MEKYRIDLVKIGSHTETIDNTNIKLTEYELTEYMDEWFYECNCDRDDYIMQLVDNETDAIICKAY